MVVLVPCRDCKCVHTSICGGAVRSRYHLLEQISSQWRSQKLLQQLIMSYKLAVYFLFWPIFNLMIWIMAILWKGCKPDNFQSHNSLKLSLLKLFEALVWILLIVNLPLSQTLLILVCVRQNWMTRLILCEGGLSSFNLKGFCYLYVWSCSLCIECTPQKDGGKKYGFGG